MAETYPPKFEEFWKAYPRKVSKLPALKAWMKSGIEEDIFMAQAAIDDVKKRTRMRWWNKDKSKIPHPATWINAQRWYDEGWEDEIDQAERKPNTGRPMPASRQPEREVSWEESMIGRLFLNYMMKAGGIKNTKIGVQIKNELMHQFVPEYRQAIETEQMTRAEVAEELAALYVHRLDSAYGLSIGNQVLAVAKRQAAKRKAA